MAEPGRADGRLRGLWRDLFGERRCAACTAVFLPDEGGDFPFCPSCAAGLPRRELGFCPRCGEPAAWPDLPPAPCLRCLEEPPPWRDFVFHGIHNGLLRALLVRLKFHESPHLGRSLGLLLARHPGLRTLEADRVTPVPLHPDRLLHRGYNQAHEIAKALAAKLRLPLCPELLDRVRSTPPQTGTSRKERLKNPRLAFQAGKKAAGGHILLVDDTLTTGATMREAADSLLRAGAASVSAAVVSRTARHG